MTTPFPPLLSLPDEQLPHVLSHLTLRDVLHLRRVCAHFRTVTFESAQHLWVDDADRGTPAADGRTSACSARRLRRLLAAFPALRALRLAGLRLARDAGPEDDDGSPRVTPWSLCAALHGAACARRLRRLELCDVAEVDAVSGEWGAASPPSYGWHADVRLEQLRELTVRVSWYAGREHPLVQSLLRSSHRITHLNLVGCGCFQDYDVEEVIMKPLATTLLHLNLSLSGVRHPVIHSTILKTLILSRCHTLRALDPGSCCPSLDVLDLSSCPVFHGEGMLDVDSGLVGFCPRLRTLDLSNCTALTYLKIALPTSTKERRDGAANGRTLVSVQSSDRADPTAMARLEHIDLSKCVMLAHATVSCPARTVYLGKCLHLRVLSLASPRLETLDLSRLPLALLSLRCPALRRLSLAGCRDLESKRSIVACAALEAVDIRDAPYVTPAFFCDPDRTCHLSIRTR